jgi:heme oxygenase
MEELREVFSEYGQFKEKPIFKATELADLGTQYYKIDNIISEYLAKANYKEHPDFLPIDRLELMIYRNKEENAKKILSKFM